MAKQASPTPPKGLGEPGAALWRAILGDLAADWELDARELYLLEQACRCADELHALEEAVDRDGFTVEGSRGQTTVHPALSEARQLRLTQMRLLGTIELVDPQSALRAATPAQKRGRDAARARWASRDERRAVAHG